MKRLKNYKSLLILQFKIKKYKKIVLISDVDGVLTDGKFYYSEHGKMFKVFGSHDSDALKLLSGNARVSIHFVTADSRGLTISKKRLNDMGFDVKLMNPPERVEFISKLNLEFFTIYIGDSFTDVRSMNVSGFSIAPNNAHHLAKQSADFITNSNSSEGSLSEACLLILKYLEKYSN
jgi:3-deoxy-D-manno-octulosonate 8-phosphate phosphatase (KDO 8-P phosphatase)